MILRHIKISELTTLISSPEYASWKVVPISPARAISQSINPFARPDDIVLTIALNDDNTEILGFIGALPCGFIKKESVRFAWLSCWWVAEEYRGKGVAMLLFKSFLASWGNKVAFTDSTKKTFEIIEGLAFCNGMKRDGVILNLRSGLYSRLNVLAIIKNKYTKIAKLAVISGIPWLIDLSANFLLSIPNRRHLRRENKNTPKKLLFPELADFDFIHSHSADNFHIPDDAELKMPEWLVKPTNQNKSLAYGYPFSSYAIDFSTFWLRWESNDKIVALVMFNLRDGVLKTLYLYSEEDFKDKLTALIFDYCFENTAIRTLVTSHPILTKYISQRKFFILSRRKFTRYSAISRELMPYFDNEPILQDGDGDYRFT